MFRRLLIEVEKQSFPPDEGLRSYAWNGKEKILVFLDKEEVEQFRKKYGAEERTQTKPVVKLEGNKWARDGWCGKK